MTAPSEQLLKQMHSSLSIIFGTDAPYRIGNVTAEKIGYAQLPCVVVPVFCRDRDLHALVPIVRQRVYRELAERGWTADDIAFTPSTQRGRRAKFVDGNESSPTYGRDKFGIVYRFSFGMERDLEAATFRAGGSYARLPDRSSDGALS